MALRARRPGSNAGQVQEQNTQVAEEQEQPQTQPEAQPEATQASVPAQRQSSAPAKTSKNAVADLNAGILENIDDLTGGGNYVTVDGTNFLYKDSNEEASEIEFVLAGGKRYYQWVDESDPDNKVFHDSDTKLDNRYKLKFEMRWFEEGEEGEPTEYIMNLSTTSAIQFINYIQALAKQGKGVGGVVTKATISRHQRKGSSDRYSRVDFTYVEDVQ